MFEKECIIEDIIKNLSQQSVDFVLKIICGLLVLIIGILFTGIILTMLFSLNDIINYFSNLV